MGIFKKYITKDAIINYLESIPSEDDLKKLERAFKIEKIFVAELRVVDNWADKFFSNLDTKEREYRLINKERHSVNFVTEDYLDRFKSVSETLISLYTGPTLLDTIITKKLLNLNYEELINLTQDEKFEYCKKRIIEYFD